MCCFCGEFCADKGAFCGELIVEVVGADEGFVTDGGALEYSVDAALLWFEKGGAKGRDGWPFGIPFNNGGAPGGGRPCESRILAAYLDSASRGPIVVSFANVIKSVICATLSASSKHLIVACGIPNAFTGSPGIDPLSITILGSSHILSSSEMPFIPLGVGVFLNLGVLGLSPFKFESGAVVLCPWIASSAIYLS